MSDKIPSAEGLIIAHGCMCPDCVCPRCLGEIACAIDRLREALMRIDAMITTSEHYTMTRGTHDQVVQIARAALEVKP